MVANDRLRLEPQGKPMSPLAPQGKMSFGPPPSSSQSRGLWPIISVRGLRSSSGCRWGEWSICCISKSMWANKKKMEVRMGRAGALRPPASKCYSHSLGITCWRCICLNCLNTFYKFLEEFWMYRKVANLERQSSVNASSSFSLTQMLHLSKLRD